MHRPVWIVWAPAARQDFRTALMRRGVFYCRKAVSAQTGYSYCGRRLAIADSHTCGQLPFTLASCRLVSTSANNFFDKLCHPGIEQINKRSPYGTIKGTTKRIRGSSGLSQHDMCAPASRAGGLWIRILLLWSLPSQHRWWHLGSDISLSKAVSNKLGSTTSSLQQT
jgi:hypothetical protein